MFNINKITAEQPSPDHYRFYNRNAMDKFQIPENFSIDPMLTKDNRCCVMFMILLKNHIKG